VSFFDYVTAHHYKQHLALRQSFSNMTLSACALAGNVDLLRLVREAQGEYLLGLEGSCTEGNTRLSCALQHLEVHETEGTVLVWIWAAAWLSGGGVGW
jgi:hypothetical protein